MVDRTTAHIVRKWDKIHANIISIMCDFDKKKQNYSVCSVNWYEKIVCSPIKLLSMAWKKKS